MPKYLIALYVAYAVVYHSQSQLPGKSLRTGRTCAFGPNFASKGVRGEWVIKASPLPQPSCLIWDGIRRQSFMRVYRNTIYCLNWTAEDRGIEYLIIEREIDCNSTARTGKAMQGMNGEPFRNQSRVKSVVRKGKRCKVDNGAHCRAGRVLVKGYCFPLIMSVSEISSMKEKIYDWDHFRFPLSNRIVTSKMSSDSSPGGCRSLSLTSL